MHNGFHPKSNVDCLCLLRSEGGRGLIVDTVEATILGLRNYGRNINERLLTAACTIEDDEDRETPNDYKKEEKE